MKIINETNVKRKKYIVEFWFLHFIGDEDCGCDYDRVEVEAISPRQAILNAEQLAPRGAKKFEIVE